VARHCTECWGQGHNKRTCPGLTERYHRYAKTETEENEGIVNPDGYWTKHYIQRTGNYPDGSKAPAGARRKQKRQCTWCKGEFGEYAEEGYDHNRRTCKYRKAWHKDSAAQASDWRSSFKQRMAASGFGVGTLIKTNQYDYYPDEQGGKRWEKQERLLIITNISWEHVHHETNRSRVVYVKDVGLPSRSCSTLCLPRAVEWTAEQEADAHERGGMRYTKEDYEVLAMSGSLATIPEGWEDGECLEISEPY
jgi:hypothetical protein